jgi:hypothetical protein
MDAPLTGALTVVFLGHKTVWRIAMGVVTLEVLISSEQYELLNEVAQRQQQSPAEISAEAIADWLEREARRREGLRILRTMPQRAVAGSEDAPRDLARNHDRYLYETRQP